MLTCGVSCPHPASARGHAGACPAGGRGSGASLTRSRLVLPALLPTPSCLLAFTSQSWSPLLPAPGGRPVGHPLSASVPSPGGVEAQPSGSQAPPSVQSHRDPGGVAAALQPRLGDGPSPLPSPLRVPVVSRWPFLPRRRSCGTRRLRAVCKDVPLPSRELLSSDAMKEYNRARVYLDENYKSQEHFTVSVLLLSAGARGPCRPHAAGRPAPGMGRA